VRSRRKASLAKQSERCARPSLAALHARDKVPTGQTGTVVDSATYRLDGHVATITYNRPDALNAINAEMRRDLNDAFSRFRDDEEAWVAIVTGSGRAFCVGADLRDGAGSAGEFPGTFWEKPTLNSFESGWEIFKPIIAAVNGYCLGYGLTLATWCDFVLASDRAEFGLPEVRLGTPAIVASIRLPQRINWADAMELLLTGERIDAERACSIGLVWRVVPHDSLLDEAHALAARLLDGSPLAQRAMKEMAMRTRHMATLEAIRFGETMRHVALATHDATEGIQAAAQHRSPRWAGR
jgi:E-phenylitaconyl-CoA hydratase